MEWIFFESREYFQSITNHTSARHRGRPSMSKGEMGERTDGGVRAMRQRGERTEMFWWDFNWYPPISVNYKSHYNLDLFLFDDHKSNRCSAFFVTNRFRLSANDQTFLDRMVCPWVVGDNLGAYGWRQRPRYPQ